MKQNPAAFGFGAVPEVETPHTPLWFWVMALLLVGYLAACTIQRENKMGADAWEHYRVVRALTEDFWHPGNPTFASDLPSPRYSPYMVGLAVVCRKTGIDPYDVLSAAAVVNTSLLVLAVWCLLSSFGEQASACAVLFVMISLWGGPPSYANSYALSDLPWHEVNPSAFSFPLVLFSWSLLYRRANSGWSFFAVAGLVLLVAVSTLDHAMTGAFGMLGLCMGVFFVPPNRRRSSIVVVGLAVICALLLCLAWPWYNFLSAVTTRQNIGHMFNPYITVRMLTIWCVPAILGALFTIPLRNRPLAGWCLAAGAAALFGGLAAFLVHSAALARLPMPGMIGLHIPIGIFAHQAGIFRPSTWLTRLRDLMTSHAGQAAQAMVQITLAAAVVFCLTPQLLEVGREPHLARAYLTKILHLRNLQQPVRKNFTDLLSPIGRRDVVLSDHYTSWMIPAFRGRIVSAIHYELFIEDQPNREQAIDLFFDPDATEQQRENIIRKYGVQWIVLNPGMLSGSLLRTLTRASAVARQTDGLVLMSASAWIAAATRN